MATKYYTHFLMQKGGNSATDEYSGVVEIQASTQQLLDTKEVEAMLAKSFHLNLSLIHI